MIVAVFDSRGEPAIRHFFECFCRDARLILGDFLIKDSVGLACINQGYLSLLNRKHAMVISGSFYCEEEEKPFLNRWRGHFALARCYQGGLQLVRSRFGGRTIYYTHCQEGNGIVACSSLTSLLQSTECLSFSKTLSASYLAAQLMGVASSPSSSSPFSSVRCLGISQVLTIRKDGSTLSESLPLLTPFTPEHQPLTPEEWKEEIESALLSAVKRGLGDAKRVAVYVGGGVDSSGVLAAAVAAARGAKKPEIKAIALDFDGPGCDRPYLKALCAALRIVPLRIKPFHASHLMEKAMVLDSAPYVWPTGAMELMMASKAVELGAERILTGYQGDDVFDGDLCLFPYQIWKRDVVGGILGALRYKVPWTALPCTRWRHWIVYPLLKYMIPSWIMPYCQSRYRRRRLSFLPYWAGPFLRAEASKLMEMQALLKIEFPVSSAASLSALTQASYLQFFWNMRSQTEVTVPGCFYVDPLADERLISLMMSVPPAFYLIGGQARGLFRMVLASFGVPDVVRFRPDKADSELAFGELLEGAGGWKSLRHLARPNALHCLGLVDASRFEDHFVKVINKGFLAVDWLNIWPVLVVESFVRAYN
ncbi:asparagine synthase-related protein [Pajaroellobacter abortibovis]|uniref:asparagine synthase (glutamine-hydrolyzing) n=1 Tax=Pajaroellobacter abortibovis TaxID=1882918 RepID=A0A1L6MVV2_9BACT|nr:asparagine synthase-related protein [Pajaroellobacter abortibovis]APR99535.1 hypothetical protein BCY86_01700 [Pajaroellobacter abortibovis]